MDTYVDGFLIPLAANRIDDYKAIATLAGQVWKDHGALAYCECIGDDLGIPGMVSFNHAAATANRARKATTLMPPLRRWHRRRHGRSRFRRLAPDGTARSCPSACCCATPAHAPQTAGASPATRP